MKTHACPTCLHEKSVEELNDDRSVSPKIKLDELVQIQDHGSAMYRVMKLDGMILELEKL
jgi:hypothetical protein